ncbi:MAG: methyltransferase domain-containing protein [Chloroflexota bacterium]|nr:MAG: methyltransferase domain-containing protein [Chloroflexota bacterium]
MTAVDPYVRRGYSAYWKARGKSTYVDLADPATRRVKAEKIVAVLKHAAGRDLDQLRCLDLGCASGAIAAVLAEDFQEVVGADPDPDAIGEATQRHQHANLRFVRAASADDLSLGGPFDVIVCNHVYEHVHDQRGLVGGIRRALAKDGLVYFSAGNALMMIEGHYGLPFLSWLPAGLATAYVRATGRSSEYLERHLTLAGLQSLLSDFAIEDYTTRILACPRQFASGDLAPPFLSPRLTAALAIAIYPLLPTYVWILRHR